MKTGLRICGGFFIFMWQSFAMLKRLKYYWLSLSSKIFGTMTIFSKIIAGEIPSYKIAENEKFYAFLDVFPLREGHVLVVPKNETDKFFDLSDDYLSELLVFAKPIARAIEKAFDCKRCGISAIGLEVPHAHLHLVPISTANDLNFTQAKLKVTPDDLKAAQEKILQYLK
jgi:histidine triad (HIT) family protein